MDHPQAFHKFKEYLKAMLKNKIGYAIASPNAPIHPALKSRDFGALVENLQKHINAFWKCEYPFSKGDFEVGPRNPLEWWQRLATHPLGSVLSVSIRHGVPSRR